jgi:hypothetical protein
VFPDLGSRQRRRTRPGSQELRKNGPNGRTGCFGVERPLEDLEDAIIHPALVLDLLLGSSSRPGHEHRLLVDTILTATGGARQEHHEGEVRELSGSCGRQAGALAVSNQAQAVGIDRFVEGQEIQRNPDVAEKLLVAAFVLVSRRAANPSVIQSKYDQSAASQVISEHEEGAMAAQGLVAILGARTRDEKDSCRGTR